MQTLKDVIKTRNVTTQELQVYKELKLFLEQFLSRDGIPTTNVIQIDNSRDIVQEVTIENIILNLDKSVYDLEKRIQDLDNLKVK